MKILVLNGSPHVNGATAHMVNAFVDGARESGHIFDDDLELVEKLPERVSFTVEAA